METKTVCPACKSTQLSATKKGFNWVVGLIGVLLCGVGIFLGFIGANKIQITCLNCGRKFAPGEGLRE